MTEKLSKGGRVEQIVLTVANVDYEDDRNGASFMDPEQRRCARKLAADGYLKLVLDTKAEVVAALTKKGKRLLERRAAAPRSKARTPTRADEREHLDESLRHAKAAYHAASDEFQRAKREGEQARIDAAHKALGTASAAYENAGLVVEAYRSKHA